MKRTIKHSDGREEVQEGTPEEFRRLDAPAMVPARDDWWEKPNPNWPDYKPPVESGQPCMFDGLPPGVYHLACPCSRHGAHC